MPFLEKIEQYMEGEMSLTEAAEFEQEVKTNPELAKALKLHQLAITGIQHKDSTDFKEFKSRMKQIDKQETPVIPLKQNKSSILRKLLAVAAMLLVTMVGYFLWPEPSSANPLASVSKELVSFHGSGTKGPDVSNSDLMNAIKLFENKQYDNAIPLLDKTIQQNPDKRAVALFLKADALSRIGKKSDAKAVLQSIQESDDAMLYKAAQRILTGSKYQTWFESEN